MSVKIYTMAHRPFDVPKSPVYIPLHVGRELSQDLGYAGDNTGEHISDLNPYYGELTGLYWVWRNEKEADIVGLCHYRRFFIGENGGLMGAAEYEAALVDCDLMTSDLLSYGETNREHFAREYDPRDLDAVGEAVRALYPEDYDAYCEMLGDTKCCYGNLMAARREVFDAYCEWLFNVLAEASDKIDVERYDLYHRRVYRVLSAMLLCVWARARGLRIREGRVAITAEKAETSELKQAVARLIEAKEAAQAKELFYGYLKVRPDIRDAMSDIRQEIPVMELLLYIMWEEEKAGITAGGLLSLGAGLPALIEHYRHTRELVRQYGGKKVRAAAADYFAAHPVSDTALDVIERDVQGTLSLYEYLNEGKPPRKVSVIVPVYNGEKHFAGCIGNLVHQTLEEIEIIFIDDCSTDNSLAVLYECQRQYPDKVRVIASPENRRAGGARNLGLDLATGEYIGFVDCDDIPDTRMYEKLYAKAKEGDYDLVDGGYLDMEHQEARLVTNDRYIGELDGEKRAGLIIAGGYLWSKLVRRELIERYHLRFREHVAIMEDADFWNFLVVTARSIGNVNEVVYRYNDSGSGLSKIKTREYAECMYAALEAVYERMHGLPNYEQVRMVLEYEMIYFYSAAVNDCIERYLRNEDFPALEQLEKLRTLRRKVARPGYANRYVREMIDRMHITIMTLNDDDPRALLRKAKREGWSFTDERK